MNHKRWTTHIAHLVIVLLLFLGHAYAATVKAENQFMQFSYTTNGAADGSINRFGNNEVSVSGDVLRVQIGDSLMDRNITGVGIYELKLQSEDLNAARKFAELLCSPKASSPGIPTTDLYIAKCNGALKSSFASDFSREMAIEISELVGRLTNAGFKNGRQLVKLDVSLLSIERANDAFLVSVRFTNGGDYPITFKTPDKWDSRIGKDTLGVSDAKSGMGGKFGLDLVGQPLVDPADFPDGEISLAPHSAAVLRVKTTNIGSFAAGTYDLHASAFMSIKVVGIESSLLYVDFHSDYKDPTRITFDRNYPSTPEERENWERIHRAELSWWPVKPGQTFGEDGLYRAVRLADNGAYRSLQLVPFKAGDIATTENVKMLMASASGAELNGPVQWLWEGSAPTPVKQWSSETIEGTKQFCKAGEVCPRSGRWLPRIRSGSSSKALRYDLAGIVTMRQGQRMPARNDGAEWEWLGV
ncbi:hypothetical protein [Caballeronia sp. GAWG1-5s-s]|uniref:hypothetical protein n=1 Tax=Caballeronia sp. GAWG1-5s-s TaxID=2921743 RepID=UPI002028AEA3|nr:hypothetical protein [Caballeronia sp. GAWG1-5s-s]